MNNPIVVRVQDVILDENHPRYSGQSSIGNILWTKINELTPPHGALTSARIAKPYNKNISHYPVANELLYIVTSPSSHYNENKTYDKYYLQPLSVHKAPSSNALPDQRRNVSKEFYQGQYFIEQSKIRPLRPYEGDITIEGRFGNSIRLGSTINNEKTPHPNNWSNEGEIGNPITILRNGQENDILANSFDHIIENINEDQSSIYLCSLQQLTSFTPASFNDASYGDDIYKESQNEEINQVNTTFTEESIIEEDITLSGANNLPPEELQKTDELSDFEGGETAQFDNSPTEPQTIGEDENITLTPDYIVPNNIDSTELNQQLGHSAPPPSPNNSDYSGG
tara:strand:+ start:531 stop:1547 length:1017 start_codon:yes stop_codon:yes gene_type:complete